MALTPSSDYHSYATVADFPATGAVDTYYLNRASCMGDENPPVTGNLYLWDGSLYIFYCALQDSSFLGPHPNHPPIHH